VARSGTGGQAASGTPEDQIEIIRYSLA